MHFSEVKAITTADLHRARCEPTRDSIIISRMNTPNLVGAVGYVESDEHGVFLPDRLWLARPRNANLTDMRWLNYRLGFGEVASRVRELATGTSSSMKNIPKGRLLELKLLVPEFSEQRSIASTLLAADNLIASLDRLIEKKRLVKLGVMQALLDGRTRLPGHTEPWTFRRIGDFAAVTTGGTPSTRVRSYWGGGIRWMNSGDIHKKRVHEVGGRITEEGVRNSNARALPRKSVLMALVGQGKTRGTVAVSQVELAINQSMAAILPSSQHDPDFLFYNLDSRYDELRGESAGDGGRGVLNLRIIRNLEVLMPSLKEQRAIGGVLCDADAEIVALERRLASVRNIKRGMMQELLTGRTRLMSEAAI